MDNSKNFKYIIVLAIAFSLFIFSGVRYLKNRNFNSLKITDTLQTASKFAKTFVDVGLKKWHKPVEVGFVVYNTGTNDLYIQDVLPDCHCTVASYSKSPVKANDSTTIKLKYDASNLGAFQSSAVVTTNATGSPVLLIFRGIVEE